MFREQATGQVKTEAQIRRENPNTSFPKPLKAEHLNGYDVVLPGPKPAPSTNLKVVVKSDPVQDANGNWVEGYTERDMFEDYTDSEGITHTKAEQEAQFLQDKADAVIAGFQVAVQNRLDSFAKTRYYNNITSACTYATSQNATFAAEGQYCVNARDTTWTYLYGELAKVKAGTRTLPASYDELETELPVLEWPV